MGAMLDKTVTGWGSGCLLRKFSFDVFFFSLHLIKFRSSYPIKVTGYSLLINIYEEYYRPFLSAGTRHACV